MSSAYLPAGFWAEFLESRWDREPAHLRRPGALWAAPLATPVEVFQGMVSAGDRVRDPARPDDPLIRERLYSSRRFRLSGPELGKYLPAAGDPSVAAYAQRLRGLLGGDRFGLIVNDFQVHHWELWMRWRALLEDLVSRLPPQTADMVMLCGDYDATPFGVHQDRRHTFMYIVEGRRRYRLWPDGYFRTPEREHARGELDYAPYLPDAVTLDAGPGDLVYWPSSYWHVGECEEGLSLTVGVGLEPFSLRDEAYKRLAERVRAAVTEADSTAAPAARSGEPVDAASVLRETAERIGAAARDLGADAGLTQVLTAVSLNHASCGGVALVPEPLPHRPLADDDRVRATPDYPILSRAAAGSLVCSAQGHSFSVPASPRVVELLERLNTGRPLRVGDAVREYAGAARAGGVEFRASPEEVRALLEELLCLRGISTVEHEMGLPAETGVVKEAP